jgi:hypothetical protein
MPQQATFRLNQLRCIVEKDESGPSEPYLWVTYFAVDGRNIAQPDPVTTFTPNYNGYRTEFPNNVSDGQVIAIQPFIATSSMTVDPGPLDFQMAGCVAVLLEEDESPNKAMDAGLRAFADAMHKTLNDLIRKRIRTIDRGPVTTEEADAIRDEVESKVKAAIKSNLTLGQKLFDNQDDVLGFSHMAFIGSEIQNRSFDFPEMVQRNILGAIRNQFVLSGSLTVGPVPPDTVDVCATQRAAVQAKRDEIKGLQNMKAVLQQQLQHATPQAKAAIVQQITATSAKITQAESELPPLVAALEACEAGPHGRTHGDLPDVVVH